MKVNQSILKKIRQIILVTGLATFALNALSENKLPAPLFEGLGNLHHPITTQSKEAQRYFDQGLTLLYAFNHAEAIRSFEAATKLDPKCAMGYWGVAYAYGPNINKPMTQDGASKAWQALQKALGLRDHVSSHEQDYINALARRYTAAPKEDRSDLDKAYAQAMKEVSEKHPDDLNAATLYVESIMDTMPWDYWTNEQTPKPATTEAISIIRSVLMRDPNHPGAHHLMIHLVEAGPNPEHGLFSADRLGKIAPSAGHLVHMPSHIYIRVGQYHDAAELNTRAARVDSEYIAHCKAQGFYPAMYYPHNMHFFWFASSIEGRSKECLESAKKIALYAIDGRCGTSEIPEATRFRHLPQLTAARFGRWKEVLQVSEPKGTNTYLFDRAMWHYSRALAYAALGNGEDAAREQSKLDQIAKSAEAKALDNPYFPASGILKVACHVAAGRAAGAQGSKTAMIEHLEKAVAAQEELPYMEPPYWYYPTRQTLAAAWMEAGEPAKAEKEFRQTLKEFPRHPWSLFGLEASLRRQGKTAAADSVKREFTEAWKHADTELNLSWF